jgi:DNA-binding CsgD family transcriptional regulator
MSELRRFGISFRKEEAISFATQVQSNPFAAAMSIDGVCGVLQEVATEHGLQYFSYLQLNGAGRCTRLVANYPQEWRKRYEDKLYIHYDPVVAVGRKSRLPFFWNNSSFIQPYRKAQQKVFYEAGNYGINFGYSIPISGKGGECGLFSIVARQEGALVDVLSTCAHPVYLLGLQLHDHVLSMTADQVRDEPEVHLTARELECLKWAAEGLTTEQIADRLSLSAATVNYHFNKIVFKFAAANRHHAAIKAVRMGLI